MENYTITREQVLRLFGGGSSDVRKCLNDMFPDAFNKELEVGKWYKQSDEPQHLFCIKKIDSNKYTFYGFNICGNFTSDYWYFIDDSQLIEATDKEVAVALINEAVKRGYKKGVKFIPLFRDGTCYKKSSIVEIKEDRILFMNNELSNDSAHRLFSSGQWSEIVPEKKVISMEKALKIVAKKYKVEPENIEIK